MMHPNAGQKATGDYREFKDVQFHGDEVTYVSLGDGTTSEGEFWEAMNSSSNLRLPIIFLVEDIDGTDPVVSYGALSRAVAHCRAGVGPSFIHAHVIRPYSHSLSDDEKAYRPDVERQRDAARDPISRMQLFLIRDGILDEKGINKLEKEVDDGLQAAVDRVLAASLPQPETIKQYLYSPNIDPTSSAFDKQVAGEGARATHESEKKPAPKTMADLI